MKFYQCRDCKAIWNAAIVMALGNCPVCDSTYTREITEEVYQKLKEKI